MPQNDDSIVLSRQEALSLLREIEVILISLHDMGSYYHDKSRADYERETTRFIDEWQVTQKLARMRAVLTVKFDLQIGPDGMDEVERALKDTKYWAAEGDSPG